MLISLLRMHFPRNWEFGSAFSKLRNFGWGLNPQPPLGTPFFVFFREMKSPTTKIKYRLKSKRNLASSVALYELMPVVWNSFDCNKR
jgi:hypothetical protein